MALWQHLHGASTHFPIVLLLVAIGFDIGAILFKKESWRTVAFWCFLVGALSTLPSVLSGLSGMNGWLGVTEKEKWYVEAGSKGEAFLLRHRNLALISGGASLLLALWRTLAKDRLRGGVFYAWLILAIAVAGGIGFVGFLGGAITHGDYGETAPATE
jgi:uncharacterized membrane protein